MSRDALLFLFAALSPLVGMVQIGVQVYFHRPPILTASPKRGAKQAATGSVLPFSISKSQLGVVMASLLVSMILSAAGFISTIQSQNALHDELSQDHLEATLKGWLVPFGYNIKDEPDSAAFFRFVGTAIQNRPITFSQMKTFPQILVVSGVVTISPEHQKILQNLPSDRMREIRHEILIEVSRFKMHSLESDPPYVILFERHLQITNSLSQNVIIDAATEVASEENLLVETVLKDIGQ